jgi:PAS domain S-box-containing protein
MKDEKKTKCQLVNELAEMRRRMNELEKMFIRHKQEAPPIKSQKLFGAIIENASDFVTIIDCDGTICYESPSIERRTGYKPEDLIGKRAFDIIHPDDLPSIQEVFNSLIQNPGKTYSAELRVQDKYGSWRILEATGRNLLNDPVAKGIVVNSRDVTEHKQVEANLRESEKLYRTLTENSLTGIYMFRGGYHIFANEMYHKITGHSWDDLKSLNPLDLIAPEYREQISGRIKRWLSGDDLISDYETKIIRKDGSIRDVFMKATGIMYEGKPTVLGNLIDITESKRMEQAFNIERERFKILCERSPVGVMIIDQKGDFKYLNPKFIELFGYDIHDIPNGKAWFRKAYPNRAYRRIVISNWIDDLESFKTRERKQKIFKVTCKDGTEKIINFMPVQLETGESSVICEDITEQRQAEETLRESENKYRTLLENIPQKIFLKDKNSVYISCNENYARDLKISHDGIIGKTDYDFYSKELAEKYRADDRRIIESGKTEEIEEKYLQNGQEVIVQTVKTPVKDKKGNISGILGIFWDITERKQAQEALVESEQKLKFILQGSPIPTFVIDRDHKILHWNRAMEELSGVRAEEAIGKKRPWKPFYGDMERPSMADLLLDGLVEEIPQWYPGKYKKSELIEEAYEATDFFHLLAGGGKWLHFTAATIRDSLNNIVGAVETLEDITERKLAEEALEKSERKSRLLAQENAIVANIGRIVSSTLNPEEVYDRFAEEVRKLIPFDGIAINIIHHRKGTVTVPYVSGITVPGCQPGDTFPLEGSVTGEITRTRSSMIIPIENLDDLQSLFPTLVGAFNVGLQSVMAVPLVFKDQIIGAIHFRSFKTNTYSEQDLRLGESIASQIAGAIANAQLFAERKQAEEAFRESEQRFTVFMEHLPAAVFIKDQSGRLVFANRYLQEIFGWEECAGKTTQELVPGEIAERMIADDRRVLTEGPMVIQERITDIRGAEHFFETYKFPIPAGGASVLLGGIAVEITGRLKTERELADTKILLQSAFEQTPVPMALVNAPAGVFLNVNRACGELLGFEDEENPRGQSIMGHNRTWQILDAEEREVAWGEMPLALALEGMTTRNREFCVVRKDGMRRWIIVNAVPIYNEVGERIAAFQVFPDITERKQAENMLRESESRFRDLVENSLTGIYILQDGQIVYKNSEQDRIFGTLPRPFNFNNFKNVHPEDLEKVKEFYEKIIATEIRKFDIDMRFFPEGEIDGSTDMKWVHARASVIEYQGRPAILINMMDVTRTRELEHLIRIDDKMTSLGRMAAGIVHELRNPLSGINVYLTALKKVYNNHPERIEPENLEKVDEIMGKLQSASNKIESVIKKVMDFSKPSTPKLTLTNINQSIEEAVNLSSTTLRKSGIQVDKSLDENLPQCFADSHLIEQVLLNLVTNAAQAMRNMVEGKKIEISSSVEKNHIIIGIADSGPGVPIMLRKKIFEPFFTTKKDSSGIGLSLCQRIIADHGGSLDVLTSKWGGSEFRITIPIEKRMTYL